MGLRVLLDPILAVFKPIVKATVRHHAGHFVALEYHDSIVPDADRVSDIGECLHRNGIEYPLTQPHTEGAHTPVSLYILSRGEKRSCHESSFWLSGQNSSSGK